MCLTLQAKVAAMLTTVGLSYGFWAEALMTAVYLQNRTPCLTLDGVTPHEAWSGMRPSYDHLRIFGCEASVCMPDEPMSCRCLLLGHGDGDF